MSECVSLKDCGRSLWPYVCIYQSTKHVRVVIRAVCMRLRIFRMYLPLFSFMVHTWNTCMICRVGFNCELFLQAGIYIEYRHLQLHLFIFDLRFVMKSFVWLKSLSTSRSPKFQLKQNPRIGTQQRNELIMIRMFYNKQAECARGKKTMMLKVKFKIVV